MKNVKIDRTLFSPKINDVFSTLEKSGIKLNELHVLEMFGRDGTAHVIEYAKKIKKLEVWEIDDKWEGDLKKNLPDAEIKIHDSVERDGVVFLCGGSDIHCSVYLEGDPNG